MCENKSSPKNINKLFQSTEELDVPEESLIEGNLPNWLQTGTILKIGPGLFDFPGFTVNHWLDGYAVLSKFEIFNNSVRFHKKFLQSDSYKRAIANKKPAIAEFGTKAFPEKGKGIFSRFVSAIMPEMSDNNSSNVFKLGINDFYVSNDACFFTKIDPDTLETGERFDTNKLFGFNGWTANLLIDNEDYGYNIGFSILTGPKFHVLKIPPNQLFETPTETFKNAKIICTIPSSYGAGISLVHSFGMTEKRYIVFIEQPYIASISSIAKAMIKEYSTRDLMEWRNNQKNRFHVIERKTGKLVKTEFLSDEAFFFIHVVNCFEYNDKIVVDVIALDNPGVLEGMYLSKLRKNIVEKVSEPSLRRFVLSTKLPKDCPEGTNLVTENQFKSRAIRHGNKLTLIPEILTEQGCEMPCINKNFFGKSYSYLYVSGTIASNSFKHSISRIDLTTKKIMAWKGNEYLYPGEPIFVNNPSSSGGDENDGIIISCVHDVKKFQRDFLLFLDAKSMKEIARVYFNSHIPGALHGIFIP